MVGSSVEEDVEDYLRDFKENYDGDKRMFTIWSEREYGIMQLFYVELVRLE